MARDRGKTGIVFGFPGKREGAVVKDDGANRARVERQRQVFARSPEVERSNKHPEPRGAWGGWNGDWAIEGGTRHVQTNWNGSGDTR